MLKTCLQTPEESVGTIGPQVPGFGCTNTILFEIKSKQKVLQSEQGVGPVMSAYVLIACAPEPPLNKGQNG